MKASLIMIGSAGLLLGVLAGRMFPPASAANGKRPDLTAPAVFPGRSAPKGPQPLAIPADKRSFAALCRLYPRVANDHAGIRREFERMNAAELREAIGEILAETAKVATDQADQAEGLRASLNLAYQELFKRDGEKALVWADELQHTLHRRWVLYGLIEAANRDAPELARPWANKLKGKGMRLSSQSALAGAVEQGAEELIRLQQVLGVDLEGAAGSEGFPEGFDFKRLITGMPASGAASAVSLDLAIGYWAGKDRTAAWSGILEATAKDQEAGSYVAGYFNGLCGMEGSAKAAADVAAKLDELPAEARDKALKALGSYEYSTAALELIPLLGDESERVKFAANYLDPHDPSDSGFQALAKLGSEALREQALRGVARRYAHGLSNREGDQHTAMVRAYFAKAMEQGRLSEESRGRVEAALAPRR